MAQRVYHWKHGWIPLTHAAALSKAHGSHAGAEKYLRAVPTAHLPRESHIVAAHKGNRFAVQDRKTGHTVGVPESTADKLHANGHKITTVHSDGSLSTEKDGKSHKVTRDGNVTAAKPGPADPADMTPDELDAEVADLMAAGDFGPRMEALSAELDKRDAPAPVQIPDKPDPLEEQRALNKLLYGTEDPPEIDLSKRRGSTTKSSRDKALRDEYDSWVLSQYSDALDATNGFFFSRDGHKAKNGPAGFDEMDFFNGRLKPAQIRKYASPELLEWFGKNPRMSFPEWRGFIVDDKQGRAAQRRLKERTLGEWG